jgi:RNA polymerase sigma-70 factor (ECF subfamily)
MDEPGVGGEPGHWREDAQTRLLVLRIQRGEGDFAELYMRYFDRIYSYLRASLGHGADAEDVAQQVFANAFGALDGFDVDGASSFRGWLFVIARNQLLKFVRGRGRVRVLAPDELVGRIDREGSAPDPAERVSRWALEAALARLPERQRQALVLRFTGDLRPAEIAQVLEITEDAVKKAQRRGLDSLERHYAEPGAPRRVLRAQMRRLDPCLPVLRARRLALLAV